MVTIRKKSSSPADISRRSRRKIKFAAIILNDIDEFVHGQMQSRIGMYNDVNLYGKTQKLQNLIRR